MIDSITVFAQLPGEAAVSPSPGGVVVVGFMFVLIVLAVLCALTFLMGAWFTRQAANSAAKAAVAAQAAAEAASAGAPVSATGFAPAASSRAGDDQDDPALIAVIAAAVHTVIGNRPHRVVSIRSAGPGWAQEGRRQIFSSHRVR